MKANDVFPSKYLKATDLQGHEPIVVIANIEMEKLGDGESKPVMYFQGHKKGMILSRTKWMEIAFKYGDESDEWIGKPVKLYTAMTTTPSGKPIEGLRAKPVAMPRNGNAAVTTSGLANPSPGFRPETQEVPPWHDDDIPDMDTR